MTVPRLVALGRQWRQLPPAAQQLQRIATFLGIKPEAAKATAKSAHEAAQEAMRAGIPLASELPADPMLELIDAPLGATLQTCALD